MIQTLKQKTVVVRAIIDSDTTEHLLSSDANRKHLMEAIDNVERGKNLIVFTPPEWNEKYSI